MPMEKTFNAAEAEARLSAMWEAAGAFKAGANARRPETFSIVIPPPNVTGSLHIGHAFNNTLQDILVRWHRMRGFDTLWQPGTDHAGIATQMVTEREMALSQEPDRRTMGREAFTARVWQQKQKSRGTIIGQLKRLGASCDWSREAFTMSGAPGAPAGEEGNFHDAVIKVFVEMYNKGLIYRGKRLVNWDPHFETAISDLEVENIEVAGHMWHFKYRLAGGESYDYVEKDASGAVSLRERRDYIAIATTRPETMLGDGAVAVHPSDPRYAPIVGKMVHLPLCDRLIPIIADEYPDPAFGSGAVKITGAHDFNDYAVAMRHNIPLYPLMDTRGVMRADDAPDNLVPAKYRGLDRFEARAQVVADITAQGLAVMAPAPAPEPGPPAAGGGAAEGEVPGLARDGARMVPLVEAKKIMQPFGDRSKVVIEPMLTDQWFVDTAKIVEPALEAVRSGRTKIIPASGEKIYFHWLENIEPWCISRQLWWGHQIPVWYGPTLTVTPANKDAPMAIQWDAREIVPFCAANFEEARGQAQAFYQSLGLPFVEEIFEVGRREDVEHENGYFPFHRRMPLYRDPDVLDTWFSSGLWPIGTLGWPEPTPELKKYFPTSVLVTGQDILFFWVARMMMMQLAVVDEIPFHTVYLHGLVRDAKGKKMSKSLGNVIDPLEVIDEYGADALRFGNAAMASLGGVLKLDTARIAGYRNFGTKLWNACRFAEMNGVWEGHATGPAPMPKASVNRWIIGEAARTLAEVDASLAAFRFDQAADALYKFVWGRVCDWYVECAKPLFDGPDAAETRATMAWVLDQCMILLHPFMPFITEELWQTTGTRARMLVHTDWPETSAAQISPAADAEMALVIGLIEEVRSARAQLRVPAALKLDMLALALTPEAARAFADNEALILRLARLNALTPAEAAPKGAITIAVEGATCAIPLAGIIDIAGETARLAKTLEKLQKEIGGLAGRLGNPNFVASAPEEIIEEARANLAAREDEAQKLSSALARLAEIG